MDEPLAYVWLGQRSGGAENGFGVASTQASHELGRVRSCPIGMTCADLRKRTGNCPFFSRIRNKVGDFLGPKSTSFTYDSSPQD